MDIFEAMYTQRAMRRLKPDPVSSDLLWRVLDAAVHAPDGGDLQPWNFLVLRDPEHDLPWRHADQPGESA